MIDVTMLANLSIINALTWYISAASFDSSAGQAIETFTLAHVPADFVFSSIHSTLAPTEVWYFTRVDALSEF